MDPTIATYDQSAKKLANYFKGIGSHDYLVYLGLSMAQALEGARVVEVGCGNGRDAADICKHVAWYEGFDPSAGMLELAHKNVPGAHFVKADALSYPYPNDLDAVFAFASFLHLNKTDFKKAAAKVAAALRPRGVFLLKLKARPKYTKELVKDEFGERLFYYYTPELVRKLTPGLRPVKELREKIGHTEWLIFVLQRV